MNQIVFGKVQQIKQAVIYLRVSTEEQVDNYSLETQEEICKKEAERRGLTVDQVFREEGRSAKNIQGRPALIQLLEYCRKHKKQIDAVIIYRLDRISRQTADYLAIRKKLAECDIKLISATEPTGNSPTEKFVETMLAGFAQMDNDVRGERSRNGLKARFLSGLTSGYLPLGYISSSGYPAKDPETFEKMQAAWKLMATGTKSLREMAIIMNKQGLRGGRDKERSFKLRSQNLSRIFRNKFYMGKIVSKKYDHEVQGQHPPMITEAEFYRVQAILDGRGINVSAKLARRNHDNPDFPLRRLVKCAHCGASFTGAWSKGKKGKYAYYFCINRCGKPSSVAAGTLDDATREYFERITPKQETVDLFVSFLRTNYFSRLSTLQKRREEADGDLKKLFETRQALIEKNLAGTYSDEMFHEQNQMLEEKIKSVQISKDDDLISKYDLEGIVTFVKNRLQNLAKTYDESSMDQLRVLVCSIFPSGMLWGNTAYSNTPFSPFYSSILGLETDEVAFGSL